MVYYCNKCGRKIEMTKGELNAQQGQVVCPQCLSVFKVPRTDAPPPPVPAKSNKKKPADEVPPVPQRRAKAAPVQQRRTPVRVAAATNTTHYNNTRSSTSSPRKQAARPTTRKKAAGKNAKKPLFGIGLGNMTPLGCLTLSVVIALVFFAFYYIFGELLH